MDKAWTDLTVTEMGWAVAAILFCITFALIVGPLVNALSHLIADALERGLRRLWVRFRK